MKSDLCAQVLNTMRDYGMVDPQRQTNILVGVSGGADSVCLLLVLSLLQEAGRIRAQLRAVHVHHGLRAAADEDEAYVKELCRKWNIPLEIRHVAVDTFAKEHGMGTEEAGHVLRQQIFKQIALDWRREDGANTPCRIALAHHLEDRVETQLFHLARGCEIQGLSGILPRSMCSLAPDAADGIEIIRPLIRSTREQIEAFLLGNRVTWRVDESNADTAYTRNLIRHEILPELEKVNTSALSHFGRLADTAMETERYLSAQTDLAWRRCAYPAIILNIPSLLEEDPLIQRRLLYRMITTCTNRKKDIGREHIDLLMELVHKEGNGRVDLPYGLCITRQYDRLIPVTPDKSFPGEAKNNQHYSPAVTEGNGFPYPFSREAYHLSVFYFDHNCASIPRNKCTKWFDYDKIHVPVVFRTRRSEDRITISRNGQSKLLTRYMIDEKIPACVREKLVLPFAGQEALWVPGGRISSQFLVEEATNRILQLRLVDGTKAGDTACCITPELWQRKGLR